MDILADIREKLPALRAQAESLMKDTCTVRRATGATTTDPVTLEEVPVFAVVLTGLMCKIKSVTAQDIDAHVPGQTVVKSSLEWHVPVATVGVKVNDVVTIDTVDSVVGDPDLVGRKFRVSGPFVRSYATARRFPVEEVV